MNPWAAARGCWVTTSIGWGRLGGLALGVAGLACGNVRLAWAAEPQAEDDVARADRLYRKGVEAYKARRYDDAWQAFQAAYETKPVVEVLRNWGAAEVRAGKVAGGARHLAQWLRATSSDGNANSEDRRIVKGLLEGAENQLAQLDITTALEGAELKVDGDAIGKTPLGFKVHVDPGKHVVEARSGELFASQTVTTSAGAVLKLNLELKSTTQLPSVSTDQTARTVPERDLPALRSQPSPLPNGLPAGTSGWDALMLVGTGLSLVGSALAVGAELHAQSQAVDSSARDRDRMLVEVGAVTLSAGALACLTSIVSITVFHAPSSFTSVAGISATRDRAAFAVQGSF